MYIAYVTYLSYVFLIVGAEWKRKIDYKNIRRYVLDDTSEENGPRYLDVKTMKN